MARTVLVTGGGTGLGKAAALRFAREGDRVAICGRRAEVLESASKENSAAGASDVGTFACDVRDDDVAKMAAALHERWGRARRPPRQCRREPRLPRREALAGRLESGHRDRPQRHLLLLLGIRPEDD